MRAEYVWADSPAFANEEPATVIPSASFPMSVAFWSEMAVIPSRIAVNASAFPSSFHAASAARINLDATSSVTPPTFCVVRES